ncbi:hypothetical protein BV25DRAFT_1823076, partial [Artomyces pyxidatus]
MPSTGYRPGQIVACQESVHTPARLALELSQDLTRTTTALSQFTARSEACSDYAKTPRPCLIMPIWFEDDPLEVCVMGTFDKARRSELAAVHRYFNMPIYPHTEYREQDIYVKTTVEWPKNAWLVAYRFPPSLQLLDPWSINGVNPEVDTTQLEWLDHHCSSLLKRWKRAIEDKAHLQRLRTNTVSSLSRRNDSERLFYSLFRRCLQSTMCYSQPCIAAIRDLRPRCQDRPHIPLVVRQGRDNLVAVFLLSGPL